MKIGRREIIMLGALGFIIYMFIGLNFIWFDFLKDAKTVNTEYLGAKTQYDGLKNEVKNISLLKDELSSVKMSNERISTYLPDNDNVIDAIVYFNKLAALAPGNLSGIKVYSPEIINIAPVGNANNSSESGSDATNTNTNTNNNNTNNANNSTGNNSSNTYMSMQVEFNTTMSYQQIKEFVNYIEGSSRKVTISQLDIKPLVDKNEEATVSGNQVVKMKLALFSLGAGSGQNPKEYNFNNYSEAENGVLKINNLNQVQSIIQKDNDKTSVTSPKNKNSSTPAPDKSTTNKETSTKDNKNSAKENSSEKKKLN